MTINALNMTNIASGSAQEVQIWSRLAFRETIYKTFFGRFLGSGPDAVFQRIADLSQGPGGVVRYDLLAKLSSYGVNSNTQLRGSEELLTYYQDTVSVNLKRNAVAFNRLSQQRTIHDLRRDAMAQLTDWFARVMDEWAAAFLTGVAAGALQTDINDFHNGSSPLTTPDKVVNSGADNPASAEPMTFDMLSKAKVLATTAQPPIRPVRIGGRSYYIALLHPWQVRSLRDTSTATTPLTLLSQALPRGESHPIISGAEFIWNGIIVYEWNYLPTGTHTGAGPDYKYGVLLGQQAMVVAFGNALPRLDYGNSRSGGQPNGFPMYWSEQVDDYGNQIGVALNLIFGMKKTRFNNKDFAVVRLRSADVES